MTTTRHVGIIVQSLDDFENQNTSVFFQSFVTSRNVAATITAEDVQRLAQHIADGDLCGYDDCAYCHPVP